MEKVVKENIGILTKIIRSTSTTVWASAVLVAAAMIAQGFMYSVSEAGQIVGITLPHEILAWAFAVIASGYAGTDRIASFVRTKSLEYGTVDLGDVSKVRKLIAITLFLLILGLVLTVVFGIPNLALEALALSFGGTAAAYVMGNKSIQAASCTEGTHKTSEKLHFVAEDDIPHGTGQK